ncbi:MAG: ATP-binding protein [Deltaproteobacteria bacterium]|nr:ATP-binding protein [Deltaproteobacteria bacterium]
MTTNGSPVGQNGRNHNFGFTVAVFESKMATMYPRLLKIEDIPPYQSFFLFGARGTGKSTLIQKYLKTQNFPFLIYDFLKSEDYLRLHSKPHQFRLEVEEHLKKNPHFPLQVHVDEVQKVPLLLDEVHSFIESHPKQVRFILSGSSARKLKRSGANLLAGRAWERKLFPLTPLELGEDFSLLSQLQFGSLPLSISLTPQEKKEYLSAYVSSYLKEEIQAEAAVRRLDSFHRFLEAAARCNGELTNFSTISSEAQVPRKTVANYYEILEQTLLGFFLPSWGHHLSRKELVTHGKFYFFDTGIVSALTQHLGGQLAEKSPLFGHYFEHFLLLQFKALHHYKGTEHRVGFYRTHSGVEIDLIEEKPGSLRAIEIKSHSELQGGDLRGLKNFGEKFPEAQLLLVCQAPKSYSLGKIRIVAWKDFLEEEWGN